MDPMDDQESDFAAFKITISRLDNIRDIIRCIKDYLFKDIVGTDIVLPKNVRQILTETFNDHQVFNGDWCSCGVTNIGESHAEHIINEFERRWYG